MSLNDDFAFQLDAIGIPYEREYKAIPGRRFLFDFYIKPNLLIELQGGVWMNKSGHNTGRGVTRDCVKSNLATLHNYKRYLYTSRTQ